MQVLVTMAGLRPMGAAVLAGVHSGFGSAKGEESNVPNAAAAPGNPGTPSPIGPPWGAISLQPSFGVQLEGDVRAKKRELRRDSGVITLPSPPPSSRDHGGRDCEIRGEEGNMKAICNFRGEGLRRKLLYYHQHKRENSAANRAWLHSIDLGIPLDPPLRSQEVLGKPAKDWDLRQGGSNPPKATPVPGPTCVLPPLKR
ncbi:hypothetical protein SKAU_G00332500 [Synaphobranchus kaupii]|uniref:Uncharacterized protein n=1 Tax=Synaphobranchus kaupii TaxID=118154 RepID=A0A9Q1ELH0_SYNKA|nr:hypothetical protein SKAU_G00332500 [Synaphobranchus kaupii]